MSEVSATVGSLEGGGGEATCQLVLPLRAETCCQPPCVQSLEHHRLPQLLPTAGPRWQMRRPDAQMRCGGPPREQASARLSSSMGR